MGIYWIHPNQTAQASIQNIMQRKIIHVDMDCFFAAIEMRDHPHLRNKPIAVGGDPEKRGVICTSNYIARQYGVRSAMSSARARRLCPALILLPPRIEGYRDEAEKIRAIFLQYTTLIEPLSLDEAFLDVTGSKHFQGSATRIAAAIRDEIYATRQLTASAGIAPNKFLAKVASDWQKPNGQTVITPDLVPDFVKALPIEKIFGVGQVTAQKMKQLNLHTCHDLQQLDLKTLVEHFGRFGERLYTLCRGQDDRPVQNDRKRKSLSVEHTFSEDLTEHADCLKALVALIGQLEKRLTRHAQRKIQKQFVKIKFDDFTHTSVETSSQTTSADCYVSLFEEGYARYRRPVRLIGVGVAFSTESSQPEQLCLDNF